MASSHATPPDDLDEPLELDPDDWDPVQVYFLLTGLIIPRPIAWVSSQDADGRRNVAPHSFFNMVAHTPPHVMFSSIGEKDTVRNVRATGEFVCNIVTMDVVEQMNFTSTNFPPDEDEFAWAGLTPAPAARVAAPRVAEAKAHLECRMTREVEVGNGRLVLGEVVHVHVDPSVWAAGRIDPAKLDPVARLAGSGYAQLGELFKLVRPRWDDVAGHDRDEVMPRLDG